MSSFVVTKRCRVAPHKDGEHCGVCEHFVITGATRRWQAFACGVFDNYLLIDEAGLVLRCRACLDYEAKEREKTTAKDD